jgi:hypothetical protein
MPVLNPAALGFTLHTASSITEPGAWGVLAFIWEPARPMAYGLSCPLPDCEFSGGDK